MNNPSLKSWKKHIHLQIMKRHADTSSGFTQSLNLFLFVSCNCIVGVNSLNRFCFQFSKIWHWRFYIGMALAAIVFLSSCLAMLRVYSAPDGCKRGLVKLHPRRTQTVFPHPFGYISSWCWDFLSSFQLRTPWSTNHKLGCFMYFCYMGGLCLCSSWVKKKRQREKKQREGPITNESVLKQEQDTTTGGAYERKTHEVGDTWSETNEGRHAQRRTGKRIRHHHWGRLMIEDRTAGRQIHKSGERW